MVGSSNLPRIADCNSREVTMVTVVFQLYQMYARTEPRVMYDVFAKYDVSFFILEDSICLAKSDNCRLPDLLDVENGQVSESVELQTPSLP